MEIHAKGLVEDLHGQLVLEESVRRTYRQHDILGAIHRGDPGIVVTVGSADRHLGLDHDGGEVVVDLAGTVRDIGLHGARLVDADGVVDVGAGPVDVINGREPLHRVKGFHFLEGTVLEVFRGVVAVGRRRCVVGEARVRETEPPGDGRGARVDPPVLVMDHVRGKVVVEDEIGAPLDVEVRGVVTEVGPVDIVLVDGRRGLHPGSHLDVRGARALRRRGNPARDLVLPGGVPGDEVAPHVLQKVQGDGLTGVEAVDVVRREVRRVAVHGGRRLALGEGVDVPRGLLDLDSGEGHLRLLQLFGVHLHIQGVHQAPELILGAARCGEVLDDVRHREPVGRDGREVLALGTVIVVDGRPHGALGRGRGDGHLPDVRKQVEVVLRGGRREVHGEGGDVRAVLLLHERPVPEEVVVHVGDLS